MKLAETKKNLTQAQENLFKAKATVSYWKTMVHEKETKDDDNGNHRFNDKDIIHEDARLKPYDLPVEQRNQCMEDLTSMLLTVPTPSSTNSHFYHKIVELEDKYHIESLYDMINYCMEIDNSIGMGLNILLTDTFSDDVSVIDAIKKMDGEADDKNK